jgi:hypothetical protein
VRATDIVSNTADWEEVGPVTVKTVRKNYYLGSQLVAMRQGSEVYYLHGDHPSASLREASLWDRAGLESTSLATDGDGDLMTETRYLPYGEERNIGDVQPTDFAFTGQRAERYKRKIKKRVAQSLPALWALFLFHPFWQTVKCHVRRATGTWPGGAGFIPP